MNADKELESILKQELEDELVTVLQKEILQELAREHNLTPEDMQSKMDNELVDNIRKIAAWLNSLTPAIDGVYQHKFKQRIPNFVGGAKPVIIECNNVYEFFQHPLLTEFYYNFADGFLKYEIDDDGYVFGHYDNEDTPRWCCGNCVRMNGKELI